MNHAALLKKRRSDFTRNGGMVQKERQLRAEIASAAGLGGGGVDPVMLMTQNYKQSFDAVGKARAAQMAKGSEVREKADSGAKDGSDTRESTARNDNGREELVRARRNRRDFSEYRHSRRRLEQGSFCEKFSDMAFRGGRLAGAVLEGEARNMFITCVARTKSSSGPQNEKQRRIIGETAVENDIEGQPAKLIFNRDVRSAVGIAVDAIHGAGRVLEIFRGLVEGSEELQDNRLEMRNINTISRLYPFLDTRGDKAIIERYSQRIKELENDSSQQSQAEKKSLKSALNKAQGVLDRKRNEQRKFLTQLDLMQNRAREAERMFASDGFADAVVEEVEALSAAPPPDDNKGNKGKGRRRRSLNNAEAVDEASSAEFTEQTGTSEQAAGQEQQEG